ncbi:MAG: hypothetical protein ACTHN5_00965 [Phycisphaerae bacterium]
MRGWVFGFVILGAGAVGWGQFPGEGQPGGGVDNAVKHANDPVHIVQPTEEKGRESVSLPAAFWNQHMTNWVEVALCGRPSDFLHETVLSVTTTKAILIQAMRDVGFHDADAWVDSVKDFPRVRGDRFLMLLDVDLPGGKHETYSLDELLEYRGWGISTGPYGWMFKGDPERAGNSNLKTQNAKPEGAATQPVDPLLQPDAPDDRFKILRDDPQIALVYKGIQHMSQSFADHPLAYDNWVYPMMRYWRNTTLLPQGVYDSNGDVAVKLTLEKVTEEELLRESARVWHDREYAAFMFKQVPVAQEIDRAKGAFWKMTAAEKKSEKGELLLAEMEKGYAELDAAWAEWSVDHAQFAAEAGDDLAAITAEASRWKTHMELKRTWAEKMYEAEVQQQRGNNGREIEARSEAMLAQTKEVGEYWRGVQAGLDRKTDPRKDWLKHVDAEVDLAAARDAAGKAGVAYGKSLEGGSANAVAQKAYAEALAGVRAAELKLELANVEFEISKREGLEGDPDLPALKKRKEEIEGELKGAETRPGK